MWIRTSLALLAILVVSGLSFPDPDEKEYKIPEVGTGQRSQYSVLQSDGTFKFGFDDGEGGFESVKSHTVGNRDGKFGYIDADGNNIRLEYEAGKGGFVARGDHLPKPSPEHIKAFSNFVKSSKPFVDPLASDDGDASYNFEFASDDHSRSEKSDADGSVTGSYSYVDENGVKRFYNYRAGKGVGFVIEGDDLTPTVHSIPSVAQHQLRTPNESVRGSSRRVSSTISGSQVGQIGSTSLSAGSSRRVSPTSGSQVGQIGSTSFSAGSSNGFQAQGALPSVSGSQFGSHGSSGVRKTSSGRKSIPTTSSTATQISATQRGGNGLRFGADHTRVSKRPIQRPFEEANIRSSFIPQGPYSFSYETSSHSRSEKGDENNNVDGKFAFIADDDGQRREIKYEAGSATGFIAEGAHIPVGPIVPGAPSGQPTGRIVPVSSNPFVDPLASSDTDASYNFGFDSETYSRTETSDKDGNVVGSYTIVDEDGTRRTYNFKAGEGIGFETEEVSRTQGAAPKKPEPYTGPLADTQPSHLPSTPSIPFGHAQTSRLPSTPSIPFAHTQTSHLPSTPSIPFAHTQTSRFPSTQSIPFGHKQTSRFPSTQSIPFGHTQTSRFPSTPSFPFSQSTQQAFTKPKSSPAPVSHIQTPSIPSTPAQFSQSHTAFRPSTPTFAAVGPTYLPPSRPFKQQNEYQDFQLNTYGAAPGAEKFGYVLRFN